ncbi:hypothetical protein ACGF07_20600 [Kitasatospora sp. NPDC048194]|uniref:hypothetical protein n=1 Tax=Kitasatospora sp. NPDC048194 TaxID=3364045 RepID=UPI0037188E19
MNGSPKERPLHDMGGAIGPADTGGARSAEEEEQGPERRPSPIGKGGTPNVAGSGEQQPEIAEGPGPGVQPGEEYGGPPRREPVAVDPPAGASRATGDASSEPVPDPSDPVPEPERGHHDPAAEPEDEGIPDLQDGSPAREWSEDPQVEAVPGDTPVAAESFGTTGAEQAEGESLDARLAQEEPETDERTAVAGVPEDAAGRLDLPDPHGDLRGEATGDTAGLSAEEEAVRIRSDGGESGAGLEEPEDLRDIPGIEAPESVEGRTGGAGAAGGSAGDGTDGEDAEGDRPPRR